MQLNSIKREVPYNYTSFSDHEVILKNFDKRIWYILSQLKNERVTGKSARLMFEIIGDIFTTKRNPYIYESYTSNIKSRTRLEQIQIEKLETIKEKAEGHPLVLEAVEIILKVLKDLQNKLKDEYSVRKLIKRRLKKATSSSNIYFSPFHTIAHVTDATDWRVEYPMVITYPQNPNEVSKLIKEAKGLGLSIIPRGGGTGLTGGALPTSENTLVINTEKLRKIGEIKYKKTKNTSIPVIEVEAGVITDDVIEYCKEKGFVFATDPTSAWASTIGGNIAENSGGKKAVRWGTAIDNIYSFKIIDSKNKLLEVKRRSHPHRKIEESDEVVFDIYEITKKKDNKLVRSIKLTGLEIRKKGLGKDITNKALGGVPGIQKEGTDGIIVSAQFVLYKPFSFSKTICFEFFGENMSEAAKAIIFIRSFLKKTDQCFLTALEHFDEKYVEAIKYRNKSSRSQIPKAVLLVDAEGDNEAEIEAKCNEVIESIKKFNAEAFLAATLATKEEFWKDRKRLGAIARHTNAFKLNEDVVIPLSGLPDFAEFVEELNIQKELENHLAILNTLEQTSISDNTFDTEENYLKEKVEFFTSESQKLKQQIKNFLESEVQSKNEYLKLKEQFEVSILKGHKTLFHGYQYAITALQQAIEKAQCKKIIIATHMHAGDGNIHVNLPVFSNDTEMMKDANEVVDKVMEKTIQLGGVISGEHGIGLTKLKYIGDDIINNFHDYKNIADPNALFNPNKLTKSFPFHTIYTPSLNLLEMEAFILEANDLKNLTESISSCVRCGKCKEVCNTSHPEQGLFYNPRNKILAVSMIVEAILFDIQMSGSPNTGYLKKLEEISNHCSMCHNCFAPCTVDIDFGEITLAIRRLLKTSKAISPKPVTSVALRYLQQKGYFSNKFLRVVLYDLFYLLQRTGSRTVKPVIKKYKRKVPKLFEMLSSQLPKAGGKTHRDEFKFNSNRHIYSFCKPDIKPIESVIYFPGCGSERMFPDISIATIALLYSENVRVIVPPDYLCCGYPFLANGRSRDAQKQAYENSVIFHKISTMVGYMNISKILVTCGTCKEMLSKYQLETIFDEVKILDVNQFAAEKLNISMDTDESPLYYHSPCHSPIEENRLKSTFQTLLKKQPIITPNCCGEGGTMALSTPEISGKLRDWKEKMIHKAKQKNSTNKNIEILTTCPSCVQGLSRIKNNISAKGTSLVQFIVRQKQGKDWRKEFIKSVKRENGIEKILF